MGAEYEIFVRLSGDDPVWIGCVSGWENLQRTLAYYANLSSGEVVAVNRRTHEVVHADGSITAFPAKRVKATAA